MTRDKRKSYLKEVNLIHIYIYTFSFVRFGFFGLTSDAPITNTQKNL